MARHSDLDTFGFLVTDIARLVRAEMDRRIGNAGLGVTAGEGRALNQAARAGVVRPSVLAERMGVEAMTASGYLDRLEARGLIERRPDPTDGRAKLVHLTEAADAVLDKVREIGCALRGEIAQRVDRAEWERFNATLRSVRDGLAVMRSEAGQRPGDAA